MLARWRLPRPVRYPLLAAPRRRSSTTVEPFKILFCGSDQFSIASLRALAALKRKEPDFIGSIDVVHRPGKPTGRGLKTIREVPIKAVATDELGLVTHELDTFKGWTQPASIDLVVAVSFGLFIPSRILNGARHGGINVHPSLLPDLHGPAPIIHTLLKKRPRTGVTVQTLDLKHFDQGTILAQTPTPGITVPKGITPDELTSMLGDLGSRMLVDVLGSRAFEPPIVDQGWYANSGGPVEHAGKITTEHRYVDFAVASAKDILRRQRVLGELWCKLPNGQRLNLHSLEPTDWARVGADIPRGLVSRNRNIYAITCDGRTLQIKSSTYPGKKRATGNSCLLDMKLVG
ncbi:methionyl-tRNA formyltransferase [Massariosphaeria phaeospora]|uniref:methionyl-tRNA formyltransferase n=1 Tax=Massariosphaeria phaeospora TaxID=100035 RepID=A0A7C8I9F6_9PLEO|nr:methionyl-tRNA formyltransferase [Massariosphaeria phaeospora]